ncbi:MAG: ABC transporter permease [Candidatus Rokubacteria bacterium]|nr:ABC transporter permease [Candidatus Rokubacteria bacterium]
MGAMHRFVRKRVAVASATFLALLALAAAFAPSLAPHDPLEQNLRAILAPPSRAHLLGTDDVGRDVLARLVHGARLSLFASIMAVAIAVTLGLPFGLAGGYLGGLTDDAIMRVSDALQSVPALVLAMAIAATLGAGLFPVMVAVGVIYAPRFARLVRGQVLALREELFVESARALGASHLRILGCHVFPNVLSPVIVQISISVAFALLAETSLSFLGVGIRPPSPSWGADVGRGYRFMALAPWLIFMPGTAILVTTLAFNFLGDGLRDALDPRHRDRTGEP